MPVIWMWVAWYLSFLGVTAFKTLVYSDIKREYVKEDPSQSPGMMRTPRSGMSSVFQSQGSYRMHGHTLKLVS